MEKELEEKYFDLLMRALNYSMEFIESQNYASLRFMDLFGSLLDLQPLMGESARDEFYEGLRQKLRDRRVMSDRETRSKRLKELMRLFVEEWKKKPSA